MNQRQLRAQRLSSYGFPTATLAVLLGIAVFTGGLAAQRGTSAAASLRAAIDKELVDGDLAGAITLYQAIVDRHAKTDTGVAAQALLSMGRAYEKLSDKRAAAVYRRIIAEFPAERAIVAEAQARLASASQRQAAVPEEQIQISERSLFHHALSADGRMMAMSSDATKGLVVRDMASGRQHHLLAKQGTALSSGFATVPLISPDLKSVIYRWREAGAAQPELRMVANDPAAVPRTILPKHTEITSVVPWSWHPSGKSVLIELQRPDQTWQLAWLTIDDSKLTVIKSLEWRRDNYAATSMRASLSPDGTFIAYDAFVSNPPGPRASRASTDRHVYLLAADGSQEREVTIGSAIDQKPVWSPDGTRLLFLSDRSGTMDLWSVAVPASQPSGSPELIRPRIGDVQPIGMVAPASYYFHRSDPEQPALTLAGLDAGAVTRDTAGSLHDLFGQRPSWSPDGSTIALLRPGRQESTFDVVVASVATRQETRYGAPGTRRLTFPLGAPLWAADGKSVLTVLQSRLTGVSAAPTRWLARLDLATGSWTDVMALDASLASGSFALTRSSALLAFASNASASGANRLVALSLETGKMVDLFVVPVGERASVSAPIAVARDGRTLAFVTSSEKETALWTIGSDGQGARQVYRTAAETISSVTFEPGGQTVLATQWPRGRPPQETQLVRISLQNGHAQPTGLFLANPDKRVSLSPDGRRLIVEDRIAAASSGVWTIRNVLAATARNSDGRTPRR